MQFTLRWIFHGFNLRICFESFAVTGLQFLNNEGSALYSIESKANHSCIPNAQATFPQSNHNLHLIALRDIQCGKFCWQISSFEQQITSCVSFEQAKRFAFHIWTIVCSAEVVIHGKRSCAKITCLIVHARSVRSRKTIQMLQATRRRTTMKRTMKAWMKTNFSVYGKTHLFVYESKQCLGVFSL